MVETGRESRTGLADCTSTDNVSARIVLLYHLVVDVVIDVAIDLLVATTTTTISHKVLKDDGT